MIKCNFCTMSDPNGKCYWSMQSFREIDCERAIKKMMKVIRNMETKKSYLINKDLRS